MTRLLDEISRTRADVTHYNEFLDLLRAHQAAFFQHLKQSDYPATEAEGHLQTLLDYHQRYPIGDQLQELAQPLIGAGLCFSLSLFDFPQKSESHAISADVERKVGWEYIPLIRRSVEGGHCRTEAALIQVMDDILHIGGPEAPAALKQVVDKNWQETKPFAEKFLRVEQTFVHDPELDDRVRQGILILIPSGENPPPNPYQNERTVLIIGALYRVLMYKEREEGRRFVKSLAEARPLYSNFLCDVSRTSLGVLRGEACW